MKKFAALAVLTLLAAAPVMAGAQIELDDSVIAPAELKAWGMASKDAKGGVQYFDVRADVALRNGATLVVSIKRNDVIVGADEWLDVAKAQVLLGTATVSLNSKEDISPVFPVKGITEIMVKYRGRAILKGHF